LKLVALPFRNGESRCGIVDAQKYVLRRRMARIRTGSGALSRGVGKFADVDGSADDA